MRRLDKKDKREEAETDAYHGDYDVEMDTQLQRRPPPPPPPIPTCAAASNWPIGMKVEITSETGAVEAEVIGQKVVDNNQVFTVKLPYGNEQEFPWMQLRTMLALDVPPGVIDSPNPNARKHPRKDIAGVKMTLNFEDWRMKTGAVDMPPATA